MDENLNACDLEFAYLFRFYRVRELRRERNMRDRHIVKHEVEAQGTARQIFSNQS